VDDINIHESQIRLTVQVLLIQSQSNITSVLGDDISKMIVSELLAQLPMSTVKYTHVWSVHIVIDQVTVVLPDQLNDVHVLLNRFAHPGMDQVEQDVSSL